MINLDTLKEQKEDILASLSVAIKNGDDKAMENALDKYGNLISDTIMNEVKSTTESVDSQILSTRGVRMLTSDEKEYYDSVIAAGKSSDPKMALTNADKTMPITIIESVLGEIPQQHPTAQLHQLPGHNWHHKNACQRTGRTDCQVGRSEHRYRQRVAGSV